MTGQHLLLKVKRWPDKNASNCICKERLIEKVKIKEQRDYLGYLMASMIVHFQGHKVLKDVLQSTIINELLTAYVNDHQLDSPLALPEKVWTGSMNKAGVPFIMRLTKLVYLTLHLRNLSKKILAHRSFRSQGILSRTPEYIISGYVLFKWENWRGHFLQNNQKENTQSLKNIKIQRMNLRSGQKKNVRENRHVTNQAVH